MIVIEFLVFVVSSGLFFNERFRHNLYAWLTAGVLATASSLLFVYHMGIVLTGPAAEAVPVKIVKERVAVLQKISQPPSPSKPEDCRDDYPFWSRLWGQEGTTDLTLQVHADGTVDGVKVAQSSGSDRLDDAAVDCVAKWHYRPAIKDGVLTDTPWTARVVWSLADTAAK
ncbi:MAG: energy transducer TonB [Rhizomicrobium sp.]|jgi:TonB family protein